MEKEEGGGDDGDVSKIVFLADTGQPHGTWRTAGKASLPTFDRAP